MKVQIPYVKLWNWAVYCRSILYGSGKLTEPEYEALNLNKMSQPGWQWRLVPVALFMLGTLIGWVAAAHYYGPHITVIIR